ncbi:hypothetical protein GCM10018987_10070 [Streptomyces cremeus]
MLLKAGVSEENIVLVDFLAAPEGIRTVHGTHPLVQIVTSSIEERLNEHAFMIPGIGDFGDRYFGTPDVGAVRRAPSAIRGQPRAGGPVRGSFPQAHSPASLRRHALAGVPVQPVEAFVRSMTSRMTTSPSTVRVRSRTRRLRWRTAVPAGARE